MADASHGHVAVLMGGVGRTVDVPTPTDGATGTPPGAPAGVDAATVRRAAPFPVAALAGDETGPATMAITSRGPTTQATARRHRE
jgi:hypothetical protein